MIDESQTHLNVIIAKTGPVLVQLPRWVRAEVNGVTIADSKRMLLVREPGKLPVYAFPRSDVLADVLGATARTEASPTLGTVEFQSLTSGSSNLSEAAFTWTSIPEAQSGLADHVGFKWDAMDHWYEEAEEVFRHPRDPFHRVDAIGSGRHVRVIHNGQTLADTTRPRLLFETGHPVRFYIPTDDIRMDLLESTSTQSACPYKGKASYWKLRGDDAGRDIMWAYLDPIPECPSIRGLLSPYNERVDTIEVDGEVLDHPVTNFR
jgi:uncharacterized protein (DUF427 family)